MLPKKSRRQDAKTLIWEYLEGEITPRRAEILSQMLTERASAREQLVESAVLHGMLQAYFRSGASASGSQADSKRKKSRRSSAA